VLPSEQDIQTVYKTATLDKNNKFVYISELPPHVYNAFLAATDSDYLSNGSSMADYTWVLIKRIFSDEFEPCDDRIIQYSSRNILYGLGHSPRPSDHLKRFLFAWKLEGALKQDEIFELFLNETYFGSGAYGISGAAAKYFSKEAKELTIAESALLAGIIKAPSRYSLTRNPQITKDRRDLVLRKMKDREMISELEFEKAISANLRD